VKLLGGNSVKIVDLEPYIVECFRTNWVFIKVVTDEGIVGWGEGTLEHRETTVAEAIREIRRYLIGQDPFAIEKHHLHMQRDCYWRSGPVLSSAISAVDIALWDIKGKALGQPVYELLGGCVTNRIKAYVNGWFAGAKSPQEFAERAVACVELGFRALKWDPFGSAYLTLSTADINAVVANVAAVREAVGLDVDLLIEGHGRLNVMSACQVGRELAPFRPMWFEEPVPPGNVDALARVRAAVPISIAAGERCYSRFDCGELLKAGAVDVLQPDVCHVGGLLELKRVAALADAAYIPISPHSPIGPVCHAATLHFAASCSNFLMLEAMATDVPWRADVATERCVFDDGYFEVPNIPGLGVELHEESFRHHPYRPHDLRHYIGQLTNIRPPDARPWYQMKKRS
jgi:galactonate dehydratase